MNISIIIELKHYLIIRRDSRCFIRDPVSRMTGTDYCQQADEPPCSKNVLDMVSYICNII